MSATLTTDTFHPVPPKEKVQATKIVIHRVEGPAEDCLSVIIERGNVGKLWQTAERMLLEMAWTARVNYGDKVDFEVTYEDGTVYGGHNLDLRHPSAPQRKTLTGHMRSFCRAYSGEFRPAHMTPAEYHAFLAHHRSEELGFYKTILERYEIGEPDDYGRDLVNESGHESGHE